jgi:hypothetical protein
MGAIPKDVSKGGAGGVEGEQFGSSHESGVGCFGIVAGQASRAARSRAWNL